MSVILRVPATSGNLGPGFDTLGLAVDLYNQLEMEIIPRGLEVTISGEGRNILPNNHHNLVYKAAMRVCAEVGLEVSGLRIVQNNQIPLSRGLGSSAAAIVGGMVAANHLLGSPFGKAKILQLATDLEGHPDNVAPALFGGVVVSLQEQAEVKYHVITPPKPLEVVILIPDFTLSTEQARSVLPTQVPFSAATFNVSRAALLVSALHSGDYQHISWACEDKLHQPYRKHLVPGLSQVIASVKAAGGLGAALSGAGPAVLAFATPGKGVRVGQAMQAAFEVHGISSRYIVTTINTGGTHIEIPSNYS